MSVLVTGFAVGEDGAPRRPPAWAPRALLAAALLCAAGCPGGGGEGGGGDGGAAADGGGTPDGGGDGLFPRAAGAVLALEVRGPYGVTADVAAALYAAAPPAFHKEAMRSGECRLLTYQPALCDAPCDGVCVDRNVCRALPPKVSAGKITFTGLKVPLSLTPQFGNAYYPPMPLQADLFDAGTAVRADAAGAALPAFQVAATGVAALEPTSLVNDEVRAPSGADYEFTWTPGADARARVRLTLNANNRGHGAPYAAIIECDAPDRGRLTVPKALINAFPSTYRWEICAGSDCPLSWAMRYTRGVTSAGDRAIELIVGSKRTFWIVHQGS